MSIEERILRVARYLRREIPPPRPPQRKKQKSFATLTEGQHVENLAPMVVGGMLFPAGTRWEVHDTTNLGVKLLSLPDQGFYQSYTLPMNTKEWKSQFKRVRRPSKKKKR